MRRFASVHAALAGYVTGLVLALCDRGIQVVAAIVVAAVAVAIAVVADLHQDRGVASSKAAVGACCGETPTRRRQTVVRVTVAAAAFAFIGLGVGQARLRAVDQSEAVKLAGCRADVVVTVLTLPVVRGDRASAEVAVDSVDGHLVHDRALLQVDVRDDGATDIGHSCDGLVEGTVLRLDGAAIEPLPEVEPGEFDYGRYLSRRGVHVVLAAPFDRVSVAGRRGGLAGFADRLRVAARRHVRAGVRSPVREILEAMVLGNDAAVDEGAVEAFRRSGLLHIMAVSGENVVLLCGIAGLGLRLAGVRRYARTAALIPVVLLYVVVTGASPSIVRAGLAGVVGLLAVLASRPSDGWLLLLAPGAFMLTLNPNTVFDVSFQLSFAAVAGLLVLSRPLTQVWSFLPASLAESAGVTTAASISTAPVSLLTFGSLSAVSVPANLAGGFVLGPIMLLGMVSVVVGFVSSWLSLPLNVVAGLFTGFLLEVARFFSNLSFAVYEWHGLTRPASIIFALAGEGAVVAWLARRDRCGRRAWLSAPRRRVRLAVVTAALLTCAFLVAPAPARPPRVPTLTLMSVGEGAAALLQAPGAPTVLFDTGPAPLYEHLRAMGVEDIDLIVLSHGHADHCGGLADVLAHYRVDQVLVADEGPEPATLAEELPQLAAAGVPVNVCRETIRFGGDGRPIVTVIPTGSAGVRAPGVGSGNQGENDCALVAVVDFGGQRVLLPGDAEGEALATLPLPQCAVVELPHHGSAGGLDVPLLEQLSPVAVVVSVGENRFGHPTSEMLDLVGGLGLPVWRTDLEGDVCLQGAGGGLSRVAPAWKHTVP